MTADELQRITQRWLQEQNRQGHDLQEQDLKPRSLAEQVVTSLNSQGQAALILMSMAPEGDQPPMEGVPLREQQYTGDCSC